MDSKKIIERLKNIDQLSQNEADKAIFDALATTNTPLTVSDINASTMDHQYDKVDEYIGHVNPNSDIRKEELKIDNHKHRKSEFVLKYGNDKEYNIYPKYFKVSHLAIVAKNAIEKQMDKLDKVNDVEMVQMLESITQSLPDMRDKLENIEQLPKEDAKNIMIDFLDITRESVDLKFMESFLPKEVFQELNERSQEHVKKMFPKYEGISQEEVEEIQKSELSELSFMFDKKSNSNIRLIPNIGSKNFYKRETFFEIKMDDIELDTFKKSIGDSMQKLNQEEYLYRGLHISEDDFEKIMNAGKEGLSRNQREDTGYVMSEQIPQAAKNDNEYRLEKSNEVTRVIRDIATRENAKEDEKEV